MPRTQKYSPLVLVILSGVFLCSLVFRSQIQKALTRYEISVFQQDLLEQEKIVLQRVAEKNKAPKPNRFFFSYTYVHDSLVEWSSKSVPIPIKANAYSFYGHFLRFKNGWYLAHKLQERDSLWVGLYRIQSTYEFENNYLKTSFSKDFSISSKAKILLKPITEDDVPIYNKTKEVLFYMSLSPADSDYVDFVSYIEWILFILILIAAGFYLKDQEKWSIYLPFALILARLGLLWLEFPGKYISHSLFDPSIYASSWFIPSLGDLLLHAFLFIYIAYLYRDKQIPNTISIAFFLVSGLINLHLSQDLILNSTLELNLENIASFHAFEYVAFGLMVLFMLLYFFFLKKIVHSSKNKLFLLLILPVGYLTPGIKQNIVQVFFLISILYVVFLHVKIRYIKDRKWFHGDLLMLGVLCIAFLGYSIQMANHEKQKNELQFLVEDQKNKHDIAFELHVQETEADIASFLSKSILELNPKDIDIQTLKEELGARSMGKYQGNYTMDIYVVYGNTFGQVLSSSNNKTKGLDYFNKIIHDFSEKTLFNRLHYIKDPSYDEDYIYQIDLNDHRYPDSYRIFITYKRYSIHETIGFTDILQNSSDPKKVPYVHYSFSTYKNQVLIHQTGHFSYPLTIPNAAKDKSSFEWNEFTHFVLKDKNYTYISSIPKQTSYTFITSCSYLFFFYFICINLGVLMFYPLAFYKYIQTIYGKIQTTILLLFFFILVLSIAGTYQYLQTEFKHRNEDLLKDKLRSITIEIEGKVKYKDELNPLVEKEFLQKMLEKFSNVFYSDINLFDQQGTLMASSISNLYQKGIVSEKMDPKAFEKLNSENYSQFIQNEHIGSLKHLSGYIPIYNQKGVFLSYLHLPYFLKNEAFNAEWNHFITSILNIYMLIFMAFFFIVALIGQWITRPLKSMEELLSNISLVENKPITYQKKDELGNFITLYNQKVDELNQKTTALTLAQKEAAWKEMARQIAHEVKNPLTPMKLSVQHLARTLKTIDEPANAQLKRFEHSMIEQIDALSQVASDFSDFAKIDQTNRTLFDVNDLLRSVCDLHQTSSLHPIQYHAPNQSVLISADKDQWTRVFNNLIKNAIQASEGVTSNEILVSLTKDKDTLLFCIQDHGKGIAQDIQSKIFTPNFTTKSEGTGLGLSIVKKIVENHSGKIWFTSSAKDGTCFYIEIPV